jgi:hypothetical protein
MNLSLLTGIAVIIQHLKQLCLPGILLQSPRVLSRCLMHPIYLEHYGVVVRGRNANKELAWKIRIRITAHHLFHEYRHFVGLVWFVSRVLNSKVVRVGVCPVESNLESHVELVESCHRRTGQCSRYWWIVNLIGT